LPVNTSFSRHELRLADARIAPGGSAKLHRYRRGSAAAGRSLASTASASALAADASSTRAQATTITFGSGDGVIERLDGGIGALPQLGRSAPAGAGPQLVGRLRALGAGDRPPERSGLGTLLARFTLGLGRDGEAAEPGGKPGVRRRHLVRGHRLRPRRPASRRRWVARAPGSPLSVLTTYGLSRATGNPGYPDRPKAIRRMYPAPYTLPLCRGLA
jgi:hypothetical protein